MPDETPARAEPTREAILSAAHDLFLDKGFHAASMRQIAEGAGIAVGGIYNHFPSKEAIFEKVFLERHPFLEVLPAMQQAQGETTEELLRDAAHRMVGALGARLEFINLMFIELVEFRGKHLDHLFQVFFPMLLGFGQRLSQKPGDLRPLPLPVFVRAFFGLFFSYVMTEMLAGRSLPPDGREGALDSMVDIFLHGVMAKP